MKYADQYGKYALEQCCHDALIYGKCNYTYITNTITGYIEPDEGKIRKATKQQKQESLVTGTYKDDDSKYYL